MWANSSGEQRKNTGGFPFSDETNFMRLTFMPKYGTIMIQESDKYDRRRIIEH